MQRVSTKGWLRFAALGLLWALGAAGSVALAQQPATLPQPVEAPPDAAQEAALESKLRALARARSAMVGLRVTAVEDALSARSLGRERSGSGVVIDEAGEQVLTIGYLLLEAEQVEIDLDADRRVPARVLAYDPASGFGLVQALSPLPLPAVPFGRSAAIESDEPLMVASGGRSGALSMARLVSKRPFSGSWEYHLDEALYTAPPRADHSGAGLFNADGELLGIGSLVVRDAGGPGEAPVSGNLFVPIDLLKPILAELRERGASASSRRAWLGLNCVERNGEVRVLRVAEDSPAEAAGLRPGDQIVAIDGTAVMTLEVLYKTLWRGDSPQREVRLEVRRGGELQSIPVLTTDRRELLRRAQGV